MKKILWSLFAAFAVCPLLAQSRFVGGDISLLPSYVENGAEYYRHDGTAITDPLAFFKSEGMNAMRVRLFVDPANAPADDKGEGVCQDLDYVKALGKQIKDQGMKFMLDFHYSDSWADPAQQFTPKAWQSLNDTQLAEQLYSYTKDVLRQLKADGAEPDFIQTGNEISYGMLWGKQGASSLYYCYPNSPASNWSRFTTLLTQAVKACREECPSAGIILHVERVSANTDLQRDNANYAALSNFYKQMAAANIDYDIIGLSYYPYFHGAMSELDGAITLLKKDFADKQVMLVETGYPYKWAVSETYDYTNIYPYSDAGQAKFTTDLIAMLKKHPNVNGLFWWWMEANEHGLDWETRRVTDSWYNAPLFDNDTGRATSALSVMQSFLDTDTGITSMEAGKDTNHNNDWYTIDGRRLPGRPSAKGIYINNGKKVAF